jgi:hypothetical protein
MRNALGVVLYVIAGFFVYMVCLLAFVNQPPIPKWGIVAGFTIPALLFLSGGLAVNRFRSWRRHAGIVLVTATGVTCFLIFTFMCLLMTDEFKQMMEPETLHFLSAYGSGVTFVVITGALGVLLLRPRKNHAEQPAGGDGKPAPQP